MKAWAYHLSFLESSIDVIGIPGGPIEQIPTDLSTFLSNDFEINQSIIHNENDVEVQEKSNNIEPFHVNESGETTSFGSTSSTSANPSITVDPSIQSSSSSAMNHEGGTIKTMKRIAPRPLSMPFLSRIIQKEIEIDEMSDEDEEYDEFIVHSPSLSPQKLNQSQTQSLVSTWIDDIIVDKKRMLTVFWLLNVFWLFANPSLFRVFVSSLITASVIYGLRNYHF